MRRASTVLAWVAIVGTVVSLANAAPFVVFPKAGQLVSPNRRLVVRTAAREAGASDFSGALDSLWLTDLSTGTSRKLCDYFGVAAVAWSGNDTVLVTQYLGKKSSRALAFSVARPEDTVVLAQPMLARLAPWQLRPALRENDHVFIEAWLLEAGSFRVHVWGYGRHDPGGFRWTCDYDLREGALSCVEAHGGK